ncbi:MAG TPA: VWA-like domain-containing protein, partial [Nocardioides sp.]|uniref:VWA-like domain-containing protein n=1 Tax=Nocardioides sp. TaxID=35761 RepID=UPI002CBB8224
DGALRALGVGDPSVTVLACDAAVGAVSRVRHARDAVLVGGGGTDLRVGLFAAEALRPRVDLVVVFTDGYTPWPAAAPPGCAVIAGVLGRDRRELPPTPGWVTRVECLLE